MFTLAFCRFCKFLTLFSFRREHVSAQLTYRQLAASEDLSSMAAKETSAAEVDENSELLLLPRHTESQQTCDVNKLVSTTFLKLANHCLSSEASNKPAPACPQQHVQSISRASNARRFGLTANLTITTDW